MDLSENWAPSDSTSVLYNLLYVKWGISEIEEKMGQTTFGRERKKKIGLKVKGRVNIEGK